MPYRIRTNPPRAAGITAVLALIAAAFFSAPEPLPAQQKAEARIVEVQGKVEVKEPGRSWQPAGAGDLVNTGAVISTGFGSSAVLEVNGSTMSVSRLTRMRIDRIAAQAGKRDTDVFLRVGKVKSEVRTAEGIDHDFRLKSTESTAAVRGTSFSFDGYNLSVEEGRVAFSDNFGRSHSIAAGQSSKVRGGGGGPSSPEEDLEKMGTTDPSTGYGPSRNLEALKELVARVEVTIVF
ncbi:MAG: FecR family protein [Spirochaetales bacterium]|nr:FecR family protein [Spirochaetales bacterium]MCF7938902.1 FecR family protein [Spirochaetales bacterium]